MQRYAPHPHRPGRPMAEQLLDRIRNEIHERLVASEAAVREYARLEAALNALGGATAAGPNPDERPTPRAGSANASGRRRAKRAPRSTARAPRGANREAVLRVLNERPGVSVTELSVAAGIGKPVL